MKYQIIRRIALFLFFLVIFTGIGDLLTKNISIPNGYGDIATVTLWIGIVLFSYICAIKIRL